MKKLLFLAVLALIQVSIFGQIATISGTIENPQPTTKVSILGFEEGKGIKTIDSALAPKGKFNFVVTLPNDGGFYQISIDEKKQLLILETNDKIEVNVDSARNISYAGSKNGIYYEKLNKLSYAMKAKASVLEKDFQAAVASKNELKQKEIQETYQAENSITVNAIKALFPEMGTSLVCIYATNFLDPEQESSFLEVVAGKFKAKGSKIPEAISFIKTIQQIQGTNVGAFAPEITQKTPAGDILKLSDLKGKYILLDFWASWCGPCRRENPNVVKAYKKFKGPEFEILSISLDQDKNSWLKAIEKDGMVWKHVSDLGYWNSKPAKDYGINGIPATFLLDKEGKIIAKNLRGEALEAKLAELFPGK